MQGLVRKLGFEERGREQKYYQDDTDALIFIMPLDQYSTE
jgi:ribosomal protein S18 acetylase RimI-like enzyme